MMTGGMDTRHLIPFFAISGIIIFLNILFCCYLARLKKAGRNEQGFKRVRYKNKRVVNETCAVCLEDFQCGERIGQCPCLHGFHILCISKWLESRNTCPVCKAPPKTTRQTESSYLVAI